MIEVKNLHKAFGEKKILKGINLIIPSKKITVILGGSGSGKSVLIKNIMGLLTPDEGDILLDGKSILNLSGRANVELRKKFGMLFQYSALFDSMSVRDNIAFPLKEHTKFKKDKIDKMIAEKLELVGLPGIEDMFPASLSGGMQKRVALARAIILGPENIVYDEPTSGLDPLMARQIDGLIVDTARALDITSLIISHDIPSTFRIADHIAVLYEGTLVAQGTPQEVKNSKNEYVQHFLDVGLA